MKKKGAANKKLKKKIKPPVHPLKSFEIAFARDLAEKRKKQNELEKPAQIKIEQEAPEAKTEVKKKLRFKTLRKFFLDTPETYRKWTTLYFGERGGGKTIHQSKVVIETLQWFVKLYRLHPKQVQRGIIVSNQNYAPEIQEQYKEYLYQWKQIAELEFCPRKNCWIKGKHALHGCLIVFDDVSIVLDPKNWTTTPDWLKEYFWLGRHYGIHILGSLVSPEVVDISFRRSVDIAYQFSSVYGTRDPDEVRPKLGFVFGIYRRRRVDAKTLWAQGDLPEQTIRLMINDREQMKSELEAQGKHELIVDDNSWYGHYHLFNWDGIFWPCGYRLGFGRLKYMFFKKVAACNTYDTLQKVKRREFAGLRCKEIRCIEPEHIHPWDYPNFSTRELKAKYPARYCDKIKRINETV